MSGAAAPLARVTRSGFTESEHLGSVAIVDASGDLLAWAGDPDAPTFARSALKPIQAAVSLARIDGTLPDDLVALMTGSHNGEEAHVRGVRRLLRRAGLGVSALACPPDRPARRADAARVARSSAVFHNCSGKHAGMLLACVERGWDTGTYVAPTHPLQRAVTRAVRDAADVEPEIGVDGCGVPVFRMPLRALATVFARLARPERLGDLAEPAARAASAMRAHPFLVAGTGRSDTELMSAIPGLLTKVGAEGVHCAALLDRGVGIAVKIADGSERAKTPVMLQALVAAGALGAGALVGLEHLSRPNVLGGGRPVGAIEPTVVLRRP